MIGTVLTTGLVLAAGSTVIENAVIKKQFPRWYKACQENKITALVSSVGVTYLVCFMFGATGLIITIAQVMSTAWSLGVTYRKREPKKTVEEVKLESVKASPKESALDWFLERMDISGTCTNMKAAA